MLNTHLKLRHLVQLLGILITASCVPTLDRKRRSAPVIPSQNQQGSPQSPSDLEDLLKELTQHSSLPIEYRSESSLRNGKAWLLLRDLAVTNLQSYLRDNRSGYEAFTKTAVASSGTPAIIFRILPEIMPEIFASNSFTLATGYYKIQDSDLLPFGIAFTQPPSSSGVPLFINFTCAACHTGRVIRQDGRTEQLIGAPSAVADVTGFRTVLTQASKSPAYTFEAFKAALLAKKDGELYGPDRIAQEKFDKLLFLGSPQKAAAGPSILSEFKDSLLKSAEYAAKTVGEYSLQGDLRLLTHSPGHIDFAMAAALATVPQTEVFANPPATFQKFLPAGPGLGDIMSVWQQDRRSFAQWDGNIKSKLFRNLGAELGIAGRPETINFANAVLTTEFISRLPPPPFPFAVDLVQAAAGKKIYARACASCHDNEVFVPLAQIGTEPGRAKGLTQATRLSLLTKLRAACSDQTNPLCQAKDDDILVPRQDNPGYVSLPLTGIWARAPYLHNGSVPTIYHLLVAEDRPQRFRLDNLNYDQQKLGFMGHSLALESDSTRTATQVIYDTNLRGLSHQGHADKNVFNGGIDFKQEPQKLDALLEYLKTL